MMSRLQRCKRAVSELPARVRAAQRDLPVMLADRGLVVSWLKSARAAYATLAICIVAGFLVWPTVRDVALSQVFPPKRSSGFLGLGARVRPHPNFAAARDAADFVYWAGSAGAFGLMMWLHVSTVVAAAGASRRGGARSDIAGSGVHHAGAGHEDKRSFERTVASGAAGGVAPPNATAADTVGPIDTVGRYRLESELGRGGMGVVHKARDTVLDRYVALKELPPALTGSAQMAERFRREARVLARLAHPHIVQVFDLVEAHGRMWMAMEMVSGGALDERLEREGALPIEDVLRLAVQTAEALGYAHAQGVVHRDFKPANVLISETGQAKVTDFGLAKLAQGGPKLTQEGALMGSPGYMSPEQASGGDIDARTDVYAFGVAVYEMLSGEPPFDGETPAQVLIQHISEPVPPLEQRRADTPAALAELVGRMLEKKREDRVQTLSEVLDVLRDIERNVGIAGVARTAIE